MADPFTRLGDDERALLRPATVPARVEPMKAVLTDERFSDDGWIYERKLDGVRCIALKDATGVRLVSRNGLALTERYAEVAAALGDDRVDDVVLDGEVVAFDGDQTSFARLQRRGREPVAIFYYVFDLLQLAGRDVTGLTLRTRKALLRDALAFDGPIRFTAHRNREGEALYREACEKGWEGVIAKRADSVYSSRRSRDWLKFKCSAQQELVIGGFTAPRGSRSDLGALLVGHYDDGALRYAGKVGTGFTRAVLHELAGKLAPLRRDDSPFADRIRERDVTWVRPELVAQIGFGEWTRDGRLRHPRYLGLRDDKRATEVVREQR